MPTIAMLASDWPTAAQAARERLELHPDDEGALVALTVALWEQGHEEEARRLADVNGTPQSNARIRASVRFHHHIDDLPGAQAALDRLADPPVAVSLGIARGWRRHGALARAVEQADALLALDSANRAATSLRRHAAAEQRVLDGSWRPATRSNSFAPVRGRVLHLLHRSLPHHRSGSTYRTDYTVRAQSEVGLEPCVVTQPGFAAPGGPAPGEPEDEAGIPHYRIAAHPTRPAGVDARLRAYLEGAAPVLERTRAAVLHPASDYTNAIVGLELGRRYGLPVVYEVRGFPEEMRRRWAASSRCTYEKSAWRREVEARCWREATSVVTLAEVMKRHIVAGGVDAERVVVIPNAVDPTAFRPVPPDPSLRARLGIAEGAFVIGYVSTLSSYEGLPHLIEAVARLTTEGRVVQGLIVGDGQERERLRQLARRLGVGDRITITGSVPHEEVLAYYALMDVFVVPRTAEITSQLVTPLKPYEAMAAGKAVVVSRTEALQEMVIEGETGVSFEPEDAGDLARVVGELWDDPDRRRRLGARACEWVREHRTWEANASRYLELYRELGSA